MDIIVFDTSWNEIAVIDDYDSLIWTDRYDECGDFEIATTPSLKMLSILRQNYYLKMENSEHIMVIEKIEIDTDVENGNRLIVSGRSVESILDRRIVWGEKIFTNVGLETAIETLLNENLISPSLSSRAIPNFIFSLSGDSRISSQMLTAQFIGDSLYDAIADLCKARQIGFKITSDSQNRFVFQLYKGANRSYSQTDNPYVVFSPSYDNLITSNYYYSNEKSKNVALVWGANPDEGETRVTATVGSSSGINRRELFVDESGSSKDSESYVTELGTKGETELAKAIEDIGYEGEAEMSQQFIYGTDFKIGDIIQIEDGFGHYGAVIVSEVVMSENEEGTSLFPTFLSFQSENQNM